MNVNNAEKIKPRFTCVFINVINKNITDINVVLYLKQSIKKRVKLFPLLSCCILYVVYPNGIINKL